MHQIVQRRPADAQQLRRLAQLPLTRASTRDDRVLLGLVAHLAQVEHGAIGVALRARPTSAAPIFGAVGHDHRALDARSPARARCPATACASIASSASGSSVIAPRRCSAAKRRTKLCASSAASPLRARSGGIVDDDLGQPVVEVLAELAR